MKTKNSFILFAFLFLAISIFFVSCSGVTPGGDPPPNNNGDITTDPDSDLGDQTDDAPPTVTSPLAGKAPTKISVEIPKTLTAGAAARSRALRSRQAVAEDEPDSSSFGRIKDQVATLGQNLSMATMQMVMIDVLIAQNSLTPGAAVHSGLSITVTQAMLDAINAAVPDEFEGMMSGAPAVGDSFDMPDFYYRVASDTAYAEEFVMSTEFADTGFSQTSNDTISWSTDKKSIKMLSDYEYTMEGMPEYGMEASKTTGSWMISYNDATKTMTAVMKGETFEGASTVASNKYSDKMQFAQIPDSLTDGVYVTLNTSYSGTYDDDYDPLTDDVSWLYSFDAEGLADNNGGYLESKYTTKYGTDFQDIWEYKEFFDGNGKLKLIQYKEFGSSVWLTDPTYDDGSGEWADYGDTWAESSDEFAEYEDDFEYTDGAIEEDFSEGGSMYFEVTAPSVPELYTMYYVTAYNDPLVLTNDIDIYADTNDEADVTDFNEKVLGTAYHYGDGLMAIYLFVELQPGTAVNLYETVYNEDYSSGIVNDVAEFENLVL